MILSQQSVVLECGGRGGRVERDSFTGIVGLEEGGRGGSNVIFSTRGFVGITVRLAILLVVASDLFFSMFTALTCSWYASTQLYNNLYHLLL